MDTQLDLKFIRRIFAFAENYSTHITSSPADMPPFLFEKPLWCLAHESESVDIAALCGEGAQIWGEPELAILLGKDATPRGVCLANDITMDHPRYKGQDHHLPFFKGQKGFCPVSSQLFPLSTLENYVLEGLHDGVLLRSGTPAQEIHPWKSLLKWLQGWLELREGDLILLGAPRRIRERMYACPGTVFEAKLNGKSVLTTRFV
jgi:2-keto-4-pentenoate hydratase/2-oxohepta-3-ene-1,7-dioic acid hydratase in catechol pathway